MKDWHVRHKIFHQIFKDMDLGDDLSKETIIEEFDQEKIVQRALEYPVKQTTALYYPGKSYAVAITFAKLLEIYFEEDFYISLNDEKLLYENDPFFTPYSQDKETYDLILDNFPLDLINTNDEKCSENFRKTQEYFLKEFLLHEDTKMYSPS